MKSTQVDSTKTAQAEKYGRLSKGDRDRQINLDLEAETQEVLETGQESEKIGKKRVKELESKNTERKQEKEDEALNKLDMSRGLPSKYREELAGSAVSYLKMLDWIVGWTADVVITDGSPIQIKAGGVTNSFRTQDGILLVVTTPDGRVFHQGMRVTQEPSLDYAAMVTLAIQMENQMDRERGSLMDNVEQRDNIPDKYKVKVPQKPAPGGLVDAAGNPLTSPST